jgi:hypothetical protein
MRYLLLLVVVLVTLLTAGATQAGRHTGTTASAKGNTANLWVDADGGSCTRHDNPGPYVGGQACGSFDAANDRCASGDIVRVKGGTYSAQSYSGSNGRSLYCVMAAARSETGTTRGLDLGRTAWLSLQGVSVVGGSSSNPKTIGLGGSGSSTANHVRLIGVSAYPGRLFIKGSAITVRGGEFGGYDSCRTGSEDDGIQVGFASQPSSEITIDGIYLHNIRRTCGSAHTDCIQFLGIRDSVVRNSRIENCPTIGIIARPQGRNIVVDGLKIENNFIGPVLDGYEAWNIGTSPDNCTNVVIQFNTFASGGSIDCAATRGNVFRGNVVAGTANCQDAVFAYNRWSRGRACGTGGRICTARYVDGRGGNFHLAAGDTCASSAVPVPLARTDIDGDMRPLRASADAGADQLESAMIATGRSIGRVAIGSSRTAVEGFYGSRRLRSARIFRGGRRALVATYRRHGAVLWVAYRAGRVVGVGTKSSYYTTVGGAGVAAPGSAAATAGGARWVSCRSAFVSTGRGILTQFGTASPTGNVTAVSIVRRAFAGRGRCS